MPVPQDNPQSAEKIALGRHLFFDGRLSADGKISCASCHDPRQAWAGHDATDTGSTAALAIAIRNCCELGLHDIPVLGRARPLAEEQALGPIQNPVEMGETLPHVVRKLAAIPGYRRQFQSAFGTGVSAMESPMPSPPLNAPSFPNRAPFLTATSRATKNAMSYGSYPWGGNSSAARAGAPACHNGPLFSDQNFHNLGVGAGAAHPDVGARR